MPSETITVWSFVKETCRIRRWRMHVYRYITMHILLFNLIRWHPTHKRGIELLVTLLAKGNECRPARRNQNIMLPFAVLWASTFTLVSSFETFRRPHFRKVQILPHASPIHLVCFPAVDFGHSPKNHEFLVKNVPPNSHKVKNAQEDSPHTMSGDDFEKFVLENKLEDFSSQIMSGTDLQTDNTKTNTNNNIPVASSNQQEPVPPSNEQEPVPSSNQPGPVPARNQQGHDSSRNLPGPVPSSNQPGLVPFSNQPERVSLGNQDGPVPSSNQPGLVQPSNHPGPVPSNDQPELYSLGNHQGPVPSSNQPGLVQPSNHPGPVPSSDQPELYSVGNHQGPVPSINQQEQVLSSSQQGPVPSSSQQGPVPSSNQPDIYPLSGQNESLPVHSHNDSKELIIDHKPKDKYLNSAIRNMEVLKLYSEPTVAIEPGTMSSQQKKPEHVVKKYSRPKAKPSQEDILPELEKDSSIKGGKAKSDKVEKNSEADTTEEVEYETEGEEESSDPESDVPTWTNAQNDKNKVKQRKLKKPREGAGDSDDEILEIIIKRTSKKGQQVLVTPMSAGTAFTGKEGSKPKLCPCIRKCTKKDKFHVCIESPDKCPCKKGIKKEVKKTHGKQVST